MLKALLPLAALLAGSAALAQEGAPVADVPELTLEQQTSLRCGVAFAGLASAQENGLAWATQYPPIEKRGKEYFVQTMARIMEDERFTRQVVFQMVQQETGRITDNGPEGVQEIMPACLALLNASGL